MIFARKRRHSVAPMRSRDTTAYATRTWISPASTADEAPSECKDKARNGMRWTIPAKTQFNPTRADTSRHEPGTWRPPTMHVSRWSHATLRHAMPRQRQRRRQRQTTSLAIRFGSMVVEGSNALAASTNKLALAHDMTKPIDRDENQGPAFTSSCRVLRGASLLVVGDDGEQAFCGWIWFRPLGRFSPYHAMAPVFPQLKRPNWSTYHAYDVYPLAQCIIRVTTDVMVRFDPIPLETLLAAILYLLSIFDICVTMTLLLLLPL